ncbi:LacI family DNA-binding transcriptional regulator [Fulvivirgaceae bacterium BMA10]|uniref:LacI family DNA-binding transcriptional regulator n=1 Tax=Splendidivirga corallicola TaxID=3051826 RepID=A0ABT8KW04_9BACT|nr:LacI family DNA-binding transcriptional regulator [Fulvivirgaceae bacterium BMA10]
MKQGKRSVTITDIARELSISPSTVSRALNNHPAIKEETKRKVITLANKLNYQPNLLALNLLNKKTNNIGVVVPEITSHFFAAIISGIQDILNASGYNIIMCQSNESYREEIKIIENLSSVRVDGFLIAPSSKTRKLDHFVKLKNSGVPIVIFDRDCQGLDVDKVLLDDYDGAFQAVDYLVKSGCKKVAHLGGSLSLSTSIHRRQGYIDALKSNNLSVRDDHIFHTKGFKHSDGIRAAKSLLKLKDPPDAIFAVNDRIAIAAMYVAKMYGFKIPEDISIIGFDDEPHSSYFTPSLSTVRQPAYSIGLLSARILLQNLSNPHDSPGFRREIFRPELIIRDSSRLRPDT